MSRSHVSPLLGYNNNVRHKNRVFHIQTEDSGIKHPHIITHLFMDGGRILKSVKRSYAEHVGADKMQETVKAMMKEQHKAMFIALRDGQFDHLLGDDGAKAKAEAKAEKDAKAAEAKPEPEKAEKASQRMKAAREKEPEPAEPAKQEMLAAEPAKDAAPPANLTPAPRTRTEPAPPPVVATPDDDDDMVPMTTRNPELTLDIEALERAAASSPGGLRQQSDLPPPHPNLFREKSAASGAYRASPPAQPVSEAKRGSGAPPKKPASQPPKKAPSQPPKKSPTSEARYAAARPAAIFGQARPQTGSSIFGEDLISDKSLDEVILSYLAEDLEPGAEKKPK